MSIFVDSLGWTIIGRGGEGSMGVAVGDFIGSEGKGGAFEI